MVKTHGLLSPLGLGSLLLAARRGLALGAAGADDVVAALNSTLGGALRRGEPVARPCFSSYDGEAVAVDEAACAAVRANYTANAFRAARGPAYMNLQSEACLSDAADQCLLDTGVSPPAVPADGAACRQGSVPAYYVAVSDADAVVAAVRFADRQPAGSGVRLSIKNSGHDYMTRNGGRASGGEISVELWVHELRGLTYHDDFVPAGCEGGDATGVGKAVTVAAGETTGDAFEFAAANGAMLLGGYSPTIALSGGYSQGGGHSVLAPVYGMGADRVAEFQVVTPDGVVRTANRCQNSDLFRALRGGGGGTFGVVLAATHLAADSTPIAVAYHTIPSNSSNDTVKEWIRLQASNSLRWAQEGWGGHVAGLYLKHFNPVPAFANLSDGGAAAVESMREATEFALSVGGTSDVEVVEDWQTAWSTYILPGAQASAGSFRFITSRLLPNDQFKTSESVQQIMDYIDAAQALGFAPQNLYVPVGTAFASNYSVQLPQLYGSGDDATNHGTSIHPAWYDSLWSLSGGFSLPWNSTYEQRLQYFTALTNVTKLQEALGGPDSGSYPNEANPLTQDWQQSWWGSNYDFLLETKRKYDPNSTLRCWKCVGYGDLYQGADDSTGDFGCQGGLQKDIDRLFT